MEFGERLKEARLRAGVSQRELAGQLCSGTYVSHIEHGRRHPTPEMVAHFENVLRLHGGDLGVAREPRKEARAMNAFAIAQWLADYGMFEEAAEQIAPMLRVASDVLPEGLRWPLLRLNVAVQERQGSVEAHKEAVTLLASQARQQGVAVMLTIAELSLLEAEMDLHRRRPREESTHAEAAVASLRSKTIPDQLRARVLTKAILALQEPPRAWAPWLHSTLPSLQGSHRAEAWLALASVAIRGGDPSKGRTFITRGAPLVDPAADFLVWARYPAEAASLLLLGGDEVLADVPPLILQARERAALSPGLELTMEAEFLDVRLEMARGRMEVAFSRLERLIDRQDVPSSSRAEAHLVMAKAFLSEGHPESAVSPAMAAARGFTMANMVHAAQEAWDVVGRARRGQ